MYHTENIKKNSFGNRTGSLAESWFISDGKSRSMAARDLVLKKRKKTSYIGWSMHALTMAQGGPARGAASSGLKLSSLTGPWIWDIVGLRKMKRALMRSSMRAAQGPWLRDENIAPGIARHWRPRTRVITSVYKLSNQPTHSARPQAKGSSFKPEATSSKILEPGYKRTSLGSGDPATRTNEFFG